MYLFWDVVRAHLLLLHGVYLYNTTHSSVLLSLLVLFTLTRDIYLRHCRDTNPLFGLLSLFNPPYPPRLSTSRPSTAATAIG